MYVREREREREGEREGERAYAFEQGLEYILQHVLEGADFLVGLVLVEEPRHLDNPPRVWRKQLEINHPLCQKRPFVLTRKVGGVQGSKQRRCEV